MSVSNAALRNVLDNITALKLDPVLYLQVIGAVCTPLLAEHRPERAASTVKKEATASASPKTSRHATAKRKRRPRSHGPAPSTVAAIDFLRRTLADGPKPVSEVEDAARRAGISVNALGRARTKTHCFPQRTNNGSSGPRAELRWPAGQ